MNEGLHVISGGASGVGLATARRFLARGEAVAVIDILPVPNVLARKDVAYFQHDVSDIDGLSAILADVVTRSPTVRSVIASAGLGLSQTFEATPIPAWKGIVDTRISGTIALIQALLPALAEEAAQRGTADIVTIGSAVDESSYVGSTIYGVASAAMRALATRLRPELHPQGVRVANLAAPLRSPSAGNPAHALDHERSEADLLTVDDVASIIDFVVHQPAGVVVHDLAVVSTVQGWS